MRGRVLLLFLVVAVSLGGCATMHVKGKPMINTSDATGFVNRPITVGKTVMTYSLYVPRDFKRDKPWPLILSLHGAGERGSDGLLQTEVGIGRAIRRHADRFPCLVAMPQCPTGVYWDKSVDIIDATLADVRAHYNIDARRIYLTGLSMGGYGTWLYAPKHINTFAALMPICGGGDPKDAAILAKVPIWAFHGKDDPVVPLQKSVEMVDAVKAAGGDARLTIYPGVGHNSWDAAYEDPESIKWLLDQVKK